MFSGDSSRTQLNLYATPPIHIRAIPSTLYQRRNIHLHEVSWSGVPSQQLVVVGSASCSKAQFNCLYECPALQTNVGGPPAQIMFIRGCTVFQQDSAPYHTAKVIKK